MKSIDHENPNNNLYESYIPVNTRKETARVDTHDILYIETELRIVIVYTISREYRFYGKLDDVQKYLNDNFYRCHKSCIINLENILRMEDGVFFFSGGVTLRVGQNNYRHARNRYIQFLEQHARVDS